MASKAARLWAGARIVFAVLLAPSAVALLFAAGKSLVLLTQKPADSQYFLIGCAAYPLVHFGTAGLGLDGFRRLMYVLGHELTHAVAAWSMGYSVKGFKIGADGGHVDVSKSNAFVALAPYVLPLYALGVVLAYRLWLWYAGAASAPLAHEVFLLSLGVTLSFHWLFTISALWTVHQPDLEMAGGTAFSLVLIALGNGLVVLAALKALFPHLVSVQEGFQLACEVTKIFWLYVFQL